MVMTNVLLCPFTEWQREVCVCFLSVVVRTHCVHPQYHLFTILVLQTQKQHGTEPSIMFEISDHNEGTICDQIKLYVKKIHVYVLYQHEIVNFVYKYQYTYNFKS